MDYGSGFAKKPANVLTYLVRTTNIATKFRCLANSLFWQKNTRISNLNPGGNK